MYSRAVIDQHFYRDENKKKPTPNPNFFISLTFTFLYVGLELLFQ